MKDHTFLFIIAFMVLMVCHPSAAQRVRHVDLEYHISDFATTSSDGMLHVSAPGFAYVYDTDTLAPALPLACVYVLVGPGETLEGFNASGSTETLLDSVDLAPNPISIPTNRTAPAKVIHPVHYTNPTYPENRAVFTGVHDMGGYRVLSFLVSPLTYSPTTRTLCITPRMRLTLELQGPGTQSQTLQSGMASVVRNLVSNPSDIETLYGVVPEPRATASGSTPTISDAPLQYLIVTCDSLKSEFQRLADWKTAKGVKATVITVEDIYSTYTGRNNQLKIKQAIKHHYDTSGSQLQYVLLGGDKNIVPVQNCYSECFGDHSNAPADIFYSCLNTMEWDSNGNNKYAELNDNVDLSLILEQGRIPTRSVLQTRNFVSRIINYETNPETNGWKNQILMCAAEDSRCVFNGDTVSWFHAASERMYDSYIHNSPWNGTKYRFYDTGTDNAAGADYNVTASNLQSELSTGYAFANIATHGFDINWAMEDGGDYLYYDAGNLQNPRSTIFITSACNTCNLNNSFALGSKMLQGANSGAIAYYGCADYAYGELSGQMGPVEHLTGRTLQNLFSSQSSMGYSVRAAKMHYLSSLGTYNEYRWHHLFMNLLGEPEASIYTDNPSSFNNMLLSLDGNRLTITPGVERFNTCIMSRFDGGESYYLSQMGYPSSISYHYPQTECTVCISHSNYIPFRTIFGQTVFLQNESLENNMNVVSKYTAIGKNVDAERDEGPVKVENGKTVILSKNGVIIENCFEVLPGASFEIRTN